VIGEPTKGKALKSVTTCDEFYDHTSLLASGGEAQDGHVSVGADRDRVR